MAAIELSLEWQGDLLFTGTAGDVQLALDGNKRDGPSPVQAVVSGLAGCMAIDVVHILQRMRTPADSIRVRVMAERAEDHPKRLISARLELEIGGDVPVRNVERAIELSRKTYCSVWHSLRPDINLSVGYEIM